MSNPSGCQYCQRRYHCHDKERGVSGGLEKPGTPGPASQPRAQPELTHRRDETRVDGVLATPGKRLLLLLFPLPNFPRQILPFICPSSAFLSPLPA